MAYLDENGLEHFWGKIKDHVDSAVAPKANDADVVHKTGDVAIEGVATFQNTSSGHSAGESVTDLIIRNPEVERGVPVEGGKSYTRVILADAEGDIEQTFAGRLGLLEVVSPKENDTSGEYLRLACYKYDYDPADPGKFAAFEVGYDLDGVRYATAPATSDDRTNSTDIVTRGYMEASEWNWQKTKKAGAVTFKPVPESDLEPVVDFVFTETPPAEGEKGPDNPSTISGVSEVKATRCEKNIIDFPYTEATSFTRAGITYTTASDGSITANGTATDRSVFYLLGQSRKKRYRAGDVITASGTPANAPDGCRLLFERNRLDGSYIGNYAITSNNLFYTFTAQDDGFFAISIVINSGVTVSNVIFYPQIEYGSTVTPFEPYAGADYTIQLGNTYYGGSLDVATGVMTVTYILEEISSNPFEVTTYDNVNVFRYKHSSQLQNNIPYVNNNSACTHFNYVASTSAGVDGYSFSDISLYFYSTTITTVEGFGAWLQEQKDAGTPVLIAYPICNPYTVSLTPTQIRSLPVLDKYEPRINTVYTDQQAVQVGYQRFANYVDLTTNQTIDGQKTFVEQLFINTGSNTYQTGIVSSQSNGIRLSSEAFSVSSSGAYLDLNGRSASSSAGCFGLGANSSAGSKLLQGKPDGTLTWNGQTIQTTSDERLKTSLSEVPDAVLDAWEEVNWGQFQYLDAVKEKGESARLHLGLIAQHVMSVFAKHGLDACDYGILCHEEREATEDGPAVDLWMVRYAEAQAMEACCMRRENARLKKRVADLEERLAALELKIS